MDNLPAPSDQQAFPVLNISQIAKLRPFGTFRKVDAGEVLIETGDDIPGLTPFATSHAGIFAVGDVRSGSVKRVAAAVGQAKRRCHMRDDRNFALGTAHWQADRRRSWLFSPPVVSPILRRLGLNRIRDLERAFHRCATMNAKRRAR